MRVPRMRQAPIVSGSIFAWRWSFQMQAVNRSEQCSVRGPSTGREAQPLIRPLGRGSSDPQAHPQTRKTGRLHLEAHPVAPLAQPLPAAQHTFNPAEPQFHGPPIARRDGAPRRVQVPPSGDQEHDVGRTILPRRARRDLHHAARRRTASRTTPACRAAGVRARSSWTA
jgi:hypothetical protein